MNDAALGFGLCVLHQLYQESLMLRVGAVLSSGVAQSMESNELWRITSSGTILRLVYSDQGK